MIDFGFDECPCERTDPDLLAISHEKIEPGYVYRKDNNSLVLDRRNWWGFALSLMIHGVILFCLWGMARPASRNNPDFLTVTLIGNDTIPEGIGAASGEGDHAGAGSISNQSVQAASDPEPELEPEKPVMRPESPEIPIPPAQATAISETKPRQEKRKNPTRNNTQTVHRKTSSLETGKAEPQAVLDRERAEKGQALQGGAGGNTQEEGTGGASGTESMGRGGNGPVTASFGSPDGPRFLKKAFPVYPDIARKLDKEGHVILQLTIDERGALVNIELIKKAGFGFDEEAVKALKQSSFCPARKDGRAVVCKVILPVKFVLKNGNDF